LTPFVTRRSSRFTRDFVEGPEFENSLRRSTRNSRRDDAGRAQHDHGTVDGNRTRLGLQEPADGWTTASHRTHMFELVKPEALLQRLLAGAFTNVAFDDARRLLEALGFDELRVRGSHHVYARPGIEEQLNVQDRGGQAKPYQLRQLVALVRRYDLRIEDD